jgi:tRNA(Arg) A34 adenosine deaminase TadA
MGVPPIASPQLFAHAPDAARLFLNSGIFLFLENGGLNMEQVTGQDLAFLRQAIDLARKARNDGRHPFGSLIVNERGETVVAARNNAVRPKGDPTQHAEMLACGQAARLLTEAELAKCTLYTSTEPCAMCAGAIYWTGIGRVVFALAETGLLRYTGTHTQNPTLDLPCREVFARGQKKIAVAGPLLEDEAGKVHEGFWVS